MRNQIAFYQHLGAVATALLVASISAWVLWNSTLLLEAMIWQALILGLIYLISKPARQDFKPGLSRIAFFALLPMIYVLSWRVPLDLFFIYSIVWIACVPNHLPKSRAWWSLALVIAGWYTIRLTLLNNDEALPKTLLEGTFHMFALISAIAAKESTLANEKTQLLNRELLATQHLLSEASRDRERTRIARDLHDLLGHHLTALTINLQVAGRLSNGDAKAKVDQCHALSKLLLSDVREAVSRLREMPIVNLKGLLGIAVKDLPQIEVLLDIDEQLQVSDVDTADAFLKFVQEATTNTLKHSKATLAVIAARIKDDQIIVRYSDDGGGCSTLIPGNGITGMQERFTRLGGNIDIQCQPHFALRATAPITT